MDIIPQRNLRPNGKPKRHKRDVFHSWMLVGAAFAGPLDMPILQATNSHPKKLISFTDAMKSSCVDFGCHVHFFADDDEILRFWSNPHQYLPKLRKFAGVLGLDASVSWDLPVPVKYFNHFRNSACTFWLQQQGIETIPQARCEPDDCEAVLAGHPHHSTIAIGARSMVRRIDDRIMLLASVRNIVSILEPSYIVWYGSDQYGVTDYLKQQGIPFSVFPGKGRGRLSWHPEKSDA